MATLRSSKIRFKETFVFPIASRKLPAFARQTNNAQPNKLALAATPGHAAEMADKA